VCVVVPAPRTVPAVSSSCRIETVSRAVAVVPHAALSATVPHFEPRLHAVGTAPGFVPGAFSSSRLDPAPSIIVPVVPRIAVVVSDSHSESRLCAAKSSCLRRVIAASSRFRARSTPPSPRFESFRCPSRARSQRLAPAFVLEFCDRLSRSYGCSSLDAHLTFHPFHFLHFLDFLVCFRRPFDTRILCLPHESILQLGGPNCDAP
jgi:hypothetical protein